MSAAASALPSAAIAQVVAELENGTLTTGDLVVLLNSTYPELASMAAYLSTAQVIQALEPLAHGKDNDLGPNMVRTVWVLLAISTVILIARLLVKWRSIRRIVYDDILIITALVFGYLHAIFITLAHDHGLGRHMAFLSPHERVYTLKIGFISLAWGFLSPMFGRIGFCIFLLSVAGIDPTIKRWTIYTFMVLQVLVNLGSIITWYSQCGTHLYVMFSMADWLEHNTYCWNLDVQSKYGYFSGSVNTLTDLFLTILPGMLILHTAFRLREKIELALLLCLSCLAMIASIVKTYESKSLSELLDYTYDLVPYVIWISIELNVVIIVASIPILRPLFMGLVARIRGTLAKHNSVQEKFENISLGSIASKRPRTKVTNVASSSSQEHIAPQQDPFAITQTVEVMVSTSANNLTFVHASLVGLVKDDTRATAVWH